MFDQITPQPNNQPGQGMPPTQPATPSSVQSMAPNPVVPPSQPPVNPYMQPAPRPIISGQPGGVEDMFAGTDNPYAMPRAGQPMGNMPKYPMRNQNMYGGGFSFGKLLLPLLGLIVLILVGIAGWLSYSYLYSKSSSDLSNLNTSTTNNQTNNSVNSNSEVPSDFPTPVTQTTSTPLVAPPGVPIPVINSATNTDSQIPTPPASQTTTPTSQAADSDSDGLADGEERTYGTDSMNSDTDSDGLIDYAEIKLYRTNPLNSDSDNDGFKDGSEVINGYDPNKAGGARLPSTTPAKI